MNMMLKYLESINPPGMGMGIEHMYVTFDPTLCVKETGCAVRWGAWSTQTMYIVPAYFPCVLDNMSGTVLHLEHNLHYGNMTLFEIDSLHYFEHWLLHVYTLSHIACTCTLSHIACTCTCTLSHIRNMHVWRSVHVPFSKAQGKW